ncbi:MAG: hypothetical protein M3347_05850, partial [Armatimonadota bacterium]|nr:hypothetical protein [Armatimonadota bacterium]
MAGQIDYMNTNGMSAPQLDNPDPKKGFADVRNLLVPESRYYRGWAVLLYHLVKDKAEAQRFLDFYKTNQKELWGATFGDVALYGQERDTAQLKVEENTATRIAFSLSDQMDDTRFNFPLTVKVRLPADWKGVITTQNGKAVEAKAVAHGGGRFALVQAVPDQGLVALTPQ